MSLLEIESLTVALPPGAARSHAVEQVSLSLEAGEMLCIVGESGSGKSVAMAAVTGLLPAGLRVTGGRVRFEGRDLLAASAGEMRALRGLRIGTVFQEPMTALNPLMRVRDQVAEVMQVHGRPAPRSRVVALLDSVGLPDPERLARAYPHQLSGGQRQRVMIAIALALEPAILVADEPTTALDVTTQMQILRLIRDVQQRRGTGVVFITHDFGVVAEIADRVAVMQSGVVVEQGRAADVLGAPQHPYTRRLIAAVPHAAFARGAAARAGTLADAAAMPAGSTTGTPGAGGGAERDPAGTIVVLGPPEAGEPAPSIDVALAALRQAASSRVSAPPGAAASEVAAAAPLLVVERVRKTYGGGFGGRTVVAVRDASLVLARGETLGLVGESGSGKSTLARCLVRLVQPESGVMRFDGTDLRPLGRRGWQPYRTRIQMVFQDPFASLNPRRRVGDIVSEGPVAHGVSRDEARARTAELLGLVGLDAGAAARFPHEFSGGQRQRIGLARALAMRPELLIADEPVSALDVSVQAQVLALLAELRARLGLTMLFITHDLRVAAQICDRVAVMRRGEIVEQGLTARVFSQPSHEYTRALLDSVPGRGWVPPVG